MPRNGLAIFIIFFGVSLVDALSGGRWVSVLFWVAMGVIFALLDSYHPFRPDQRRDRKEVFPPAS